MKQGLSPDWITRLFEHPDLLRMGHHQRAEDQNLGMGWLYYAFGRMIRPRLAVVIGSWRGFVSSRARAPTPPSTIAGPTVNCWPGCSVPAFAFRRDFRC